MSVLVKVGLTATILAVGCTGTYFLMSGAGFMPDYTTVSGASDTSTYTGKIGVEYKHILVDTGKNKEWWEWSFGRLPKNKKGDSTEFGDGKITMAFHDTTTTALNKVCDAAYKKSATNDVDFSKPASAAESKHKLGKDILKYCSPLGERPDTIGDHKSETYSDTSHIGGGSDKTTLASTKSPKNHNFWSAMQKYLNKEGTKPTDAFFKRISDQKTIKTLCQEAYGKTATTSTASETQPKLDDVKKYCSFAKLTT